MYKWYLPVSLLVCVLPEVDCWTKILVQVTYFGDDPKKWVKANIRGKEREPIKDELSGNLPLWVTGS